MFGCIEARGVPVLFCMLRHFSSYMERLLKYVVSTQERFWQGTKVTKINSVSKTTESIHKSNIFFIYIFSIFPKWKLPIQSNTRNFEIIETNAFDEPMSTTYSLTLVPVPYVRKCIKCLLSLYDYHSYFSLTLNQDMTSEEYIYGIMRLIGLEFWHRWL